MSNVIAKLCREDEIERAYLALEITRSDAIHSLVALGHLQENAEDMVDEWFADDLFLTEEREAAWTLLVEAAEAIEKQLDERQKLDRRIHCQRRALRENWEIVEQRRKWLGSSSARQAYGRLVKRHRALLRELKIAAAAPPEASFDNPEDMLAWLNEAPHG